MPAHHTKADEYIDTHHGAEPTEEYFGVCSCCHGTGTTPEYNDRGRYLGDETCQNCGGDGLSERKEEPDAP